MPLPTTHLFETFDCMNNYQNAAIAGLHWISGDQKKAMIDAYFQQRPKPNAVSKTREEIGLDREDIGCSTHRVHYDYDETSDSHADLDIQIVEMVEKELAAEGVYSLHFFKGLDILYNYPQRFEFFKAKGLDNQFTVVISAFDVNNKLVYQGDLTHMIP